MTVAVGSKAVPHTTVMQALRDSFWACAGVESVDKYGVRGLSPFGQTRSRGDSASEETAKPGLAVPVGEGEGEGKDFQPPVHRGLGLGQADRISAAGFARSRACRQSFLGLSQYPPQPTGHPIHRNSF